MTNHDKSRTVRGMPVITGEGLAHMLRSYRKGQLGRWKKDILGDSTNPEEDAPNPRLYEAVGNVLEKEGIKLDSPERDALVEVVVTAVYGIIQDAGERLDHPADRSTLVYEPENSRSRVNFATDDRLRKAVSRLYEMLKPGQQLDAMPVIQKIYDLANAVPVELRERIEDLEDALKIAEGSASEIEEELGRKRAMLGGEILELKKELESMYRDEGAPVLVRADYSSSGLSEIAQEPEFRDLDSSDLEYLLPQDTPFPHDWDDDSETDLE
ncbi:hypothetical protein COU60_02390 [Candidatus Pacearchaeota archaeon CG10_big_fil_rev_8_21_14_0_10_34_76]|nr:MAG: hypothetical protein COU60_02390 [Candidatus Pacearchaeota archaeon CG10_big_fil_rev_8_21_14_0_10_34_76]